VTAAPWGSTCGRGEGRDGPNRCRPGRVRPVRPGAKLISEAGSGGPMPTLEGLLDEMARRLEPEVKRRLQGFLGGFLRAYLPQTWVFRSGAETASLTVSATGEPSVTPGAVEHPDVTVEIPLERLRAALQGHGAAGAPPEAQVTTHTAKGRAAFGYLRERLGL
jgi:hypothetical protein